MSWNNVSPWWVWEIGYERKLAEMSCAFPNEIFAGTFKATPDYIYDIHPSNFKSWEKGGWNHGKEKT